MASRERAVLNDLNARARAAGCTDVLSLDDLRAVREFYGDHCLVSDCQNKHCTFDHVVALSNGGENKRSNLQLLCASHNKAKRNKDTDYRSGRICPNDFASTKETYTKHDWDEIEFEYVHTDSTLRDLAKMFDVARSHIELVCARDDWVAKRQNYRGKIGAAILKEVEATNVREGFSAYRATFVLLRRAYDDYVNEPSVEKLRAMDSLISKGLVLEGYEIDRKGVTVKDWRDAANKHDPAAAEGITEFAERIARASFDGGDSGSDREPGAGWTD